MDDVLARLAAMLPHSAYDYLAFLIVYVVLTAITVLVLRVVLPSRPDARSKAVWTDAALCDYIDRAVSSRLAVQRAYITSAYQLMPVADRLAHACRRLERDRPEEGAARMSVASVTVLESATRPWC